MPSHYGAAYYLDLMAMPVDAYAMVSRLRARKLQPHIKPSDTVFEFGVGSGLNLASLDCAGRTGFDINPNSSVEAAKHGIQMVGAEDAGRYDIVICHHVLEHVLSPAECLNSLRDRLNTNGRLLLYVPYEEQRRYQKHIASDPNHHLYSWTPHTLANLLSECGYDVQSASLGAFGYERFAARIAAQYRLGAMGFHLIHRLAHLLRGEREVRLVARRRG